jgi:hypothetical protein
MISILAGPFTGVEWVALDPIPGRRSAGGVANVMPRENFADYLLCRLPEKARYVLVRRYGPDYRDPPTLVELAAELNLL